MHPGGAGYVCRMGVRASFVTGLVCVVGVLGTFLFLHTGSRAAELCARDGAAVPDGLSWWPPGARCAGGEPVATTTKLDPLVGLVVPGIALLAFGGAALSGSRGRRRETAA